MVEVGCDLREAAALVVLLLADPAAAARLRLRILVVRVVRRCAQGLSLSFELGGTVLETRS